jgi:hypothetical protein
MGQQRGTSPVAGGRTTASRGGLAAAALGVAVITLR